MRIQFLKKLSFLCCLSVAFIGGIFHAAAATQVALISPTNTWRFNDGGQDLGTAWFAPGYDDSINTWSNGAVAIGFAGLGSTNEALPAPNFIRTVPRKNSLTNAAVNILTFYFRHHFTVTNPRGLVLTASNLIDDGAVFYVNGREVERVAMPEGGVGYSTLSLRNDDIGTSRTPTVNTHGYDVFNVPLDALVIGDNVIAVEVHQANTGSSDFLFQTELWANYPDPTFLAITSQPTPVMEEEGKSVTVQVGVSGAGAGYQWYRRNTGGGATAIPGAFGDRYVIPVAATNDTGIYYVIVSNAVNSVTSSDVQITVVSDITGPIIIDADGSLTTTNVLISFADPVLPSTATNIANYRITNTLGGLLVVRSAVLTNATNVLLTATNARLANQNYLVIINGLRDTSLRTNLITANSMFPISNLSTNIVGLNASPWRYYDPYVDFPLFDAPNLGTAWRNPGYVETNTWQNGGGVFNYSENGQSPAGVPQGTFLGQTRDGITYFRYVIPGTFSAGNRKFALTHVIDDGAVVYLNGTEVFRVGLPAAPAAIAYNTRSTSAIGVPVRTGPVQLTGPFTSTGNLLAVELHQNVAFDLDKFMGLQIDAFVRSVGIGPVFITGGPASITVFEGDSATFEVVQVGGTSFQWQRNNANIAGATGDSLTISNVTFAMNNQTFRVMVSGANGTFTSTNATLRVLTDTTPPTIVSAYASPNSIVVSFSESMGVVSASVPANYTVTNSAGATFPVTAASLANGTDVTLSFASLPAAQYFVTVNRVRDAATTGNVIATNSTVKAGFNGTAIGYAGTWRYEQSGLDLRAQGWTNRTFNDAAWLSGPGLLDGKAGGRISTTLPLPVGTVILAPTNGPGGRYLTNVYFRGHFNSYGSGSGTINFSTVIDDGAVIYLNGRELNRIRMPVGTVTAATFANASAGDAVVEGPFSFSVTNFVAGDNVIAVEIHQNATGSSDTTWGGQFDVLIPSEIVLTNVAPPVPTCTNIVFAAPTVNLQRAATGTNIVLSWTNPVTNSCGSNAVYTLQQTLSLAATPAATVWSDITTVSPHTAIGTNTSRFFRLRR